MDENRSDWYPLLTVFIQERKGSVNITNLPPPPHLFKPNLPECPAAAGRRRRREFSSVAWGTHGGSELQRGVGNFNGVDSVPERGWGTIIGTNTPVRQTLARERKKADAL